MQSADDYDFDDPLYQADLDSLLGRLFKRRHADRSRHDDLAAELGCSEPSVQRRLKEARLKEQAAEQQAEEVKVRELRARGWGWKKIAAELHAGRDRLRSMYGEISTSP